MMSPTKRWQSFVKNDALVIALLFGMLAVLSIVQIGGIRKATEAAQKAEKAAGATRLIEECQTPGTLCYEYSRQREEAEQSARRAESFCHLDVLLAAPPPPRTAEQSQIAKQQYLNCIENRTLPEPVSPTTSTTSRSNGNGD